MEWVSSCDWRQWLSIFATHSRGTGPISQYLLTAGQRLQGMEVRSPGKSMVECACQQLQDGRSHAGEARWMGKTLAERATVQATEP